MALSPVLTNKIPFDSTVSTTFSFTYNGNQVQKNRLIIKKASDNTVIYDKTQITMQMYHTLALNVLTNGINYTAQLSVFDTNNVESPLSNTILFSCLSTPSFSFSNLTASQTINNSYYEFQLSYSQTQGELLSSYELYLYDSSQKQLNQTSLLYDVNNLKYTFANFTDKTEYYIRATGETVNGISLDTGLISFNIAYTTPSMFAITQLENLPDSGQLKFTCNMKAIAGTSNPSTPIYINNEKIDLTQYNKTTTYSDTKTLNGTSLKFDPFRYKTIINSLTVNGKTVETGSGDKSPDNPYTLSGTTALTVSDGGNQSQTIALPQTLYSLSDGKADNYDAVSGQGVQNVGKVILNGSESGWSDTTSWISSTLPDYYQFTRTMPTTEKEYTTAHCSHFNYYAYDSVTAAEGLYIGGSHCFHFRVLKSRFADLTAFKTWLAANPVTVLYQLAAPPAISGAGQTIPVYHPTTNITNDTNSMMNISYTDLCYKSDASVVFNENFNIANDFTLETIASDFYPYQNAYEFSNGINTITLKYMLNVFDNTVGQQGWFLLEVPNAVTSYRIATQPFTPLTSGQQVYLLVRRIGYLYDIVMKLV